MNIADPNFAWVLASQEDITVVLALMQGFYAEENLHYNGAAASIAVSNLLADPGIGAVFLLRDSVGEPRGYFVVTLGYSLEFGGRYALLDELFLQPSARGQGAGKSALNVAESWAVSCKATTLRLEVNHHNKKARSIYLKSGFQDDQRDLLSKRISLSDQ